MLSTQDSSRPKNVPAFHFNPCSDALKMIDPTDLHAREYTSDDRTSCLTIFDSNYPKFFAEEERAMFSDWLDQPDRASYQVIELDGRVVACGGIYHDDGKGQTGLAWGMVHSELHGQGIGRFLTRIRVEQMTAQFPELTQHLGTSQHTFQFYEKMGFAVTKVTTDGFGPGIDRYDMSREPTP